MTVNEIATVTDTANQINVTNEDASVDKDSSVIRVNITIENRSKKKQPIFRLVDFAVTPQNKGGDAPMQVLGTDMDDDSPSYSLVLPGNYRRTFNNYYEVEYYKVSIEKIKKVFFDYGTARWKLKVSIPKK